MKHLKEFPINETKINQKHSSMSEITVETIKNQIYSSLIEYYEFTDVVLTDPNVEFSIDNIATKKMKRLVEEIENIHNESEFKFLVDKIKEKI